MEQIHEKFKKGFTIIELIISIFILSVAVIGIFNAFSTIAILTSDSANRLIAAYLAQEGIEIVRNIRDTNWLNMDFSPDSYNWNDNLTPGSSNSPVDCSNGCEADYTTGTSNQGTSVMIPYSGRYLNLDSNGFYNYSSGTATKFKRKITITCLPDQNNCASEDVMEVVVRVSWDQGANALNKGGLTADTCNTSGGESNCIVVETALYNWYNPASQ